MFMEKFVKVTYGSCTETPRRFSECESMSKMVA